MGAVTDVEADIGAVASHNLMSGNTYHVAQSGKDYWSWRNHSWNARTDAGYGQEIGSTVGTALPPPLSPVCQ